MVGFYIFVTICTATLSVSWTLPVTGRESVHGRINYRAPRTVSLDSESYLEKYGYLDVGAVPDTGEQIPHSEDNRRHAISTFQQMAGINVTGEMDQDTADKMRLPRCGFPDITADFDPTRALDFNAVTRWKKNTVTWKIMSYSGKLTHQQQRRAIWDGFNYWAKASGLQLQETAGEADINIEFASGNHGDGVTNQFNGKGGVLAHAFLPLDGKTHFDADEDWTLHNNEGTELESVAAHEFGHALGLHHSVVGGSIMAPFYRPYVPDFQLHEDDINAIRHLYGPPATIPTTTVQTTTTTTPTIITTMEAMRQPIGSTDAPVSSACVAKLNTVVIATLGIIASLNIRML